MRVLTNLAYIKNGFENGLGYATRDVILGLKSNGQLADFTFVVRDTAAEALAEIIPEEQLVVIPPSKLLDAMGGKLGLVARYLKEFYYQCFAMRKIIRRRQHEYDVLFNFIGRVENTLKTKLPSVSVVHDIYYKQKGARYKVLYPVNELGTRHMLKKSTRVTTISHYVKNDILKLFPFVDAEKIVPIHNPIILPVLEKKPEPPLAKPYILNINAHAVHKNHITLLRAYNSLCKEYEHDLVFIGSEQEGTPGLKEFIAQNGLTGRVHLLSGVPQEVLVQYLCNASLFVTPSLFEGFGRTPVEAAMYEVPVISSRETSLPEATMEKVAYYEPACDEKALEKTMRDMLSDPPSPKARRALAEEFRTYYAAPRVADRYYEVLQGLCGK